MLDWMPDINDKPIISRKKMYWYSDNQQTEHILHLNHLIENRMSELGCIMGAVGAGWMMDFEELMDCIPAFGPGDTFG